MTKIGLFRHATNARDVAAGTVIFKENDPGEEMFVVVSGKIEILTGGRLIDTLEEGDIFGELALIDDLPRSGTAVAKTDARIVPISEKRFVFLVEETPYFALQVMRIMADRLRRALVAATGAPTPAR